MTAPLPCPRCGNEPEVSGSPYTTIACGNCYGYCTESGHDSEIGVGLAREKAIENWNEAVQQYYDSWLCSGCGCDLPEADLILCERCQNANAPQVGLGGVQGAGSQADATCDRRHTEDSREVNVREEKPVDNSDAK